MSSSRSTLIVTSGVSMPPILLFTAQFERTLSNENEDADSVFFDKIFQFKHTHIYLFLGEWLFSSEIWGGFKHR